MCDERFKVVVHHGGNFVQNGALFYVGGFIDDWSCDPDTRGILRC